MNKTSRKTAAKWNLLTYNDFYFPQCYDFIRKKDSCSQYSFILWFLKLFLYFKLESFQGALAPKILNYNKEKCFYSYRHPNYFLISLSFENALDVNMSKSHWKIKQRREKSYVFYFMVIVLIRIFVEFL